ncbi:MAG TPA: helix-turn-helix domain-containing protein [Solirubrobacteraceae bacterium]|nr:helix-turn-helix domain-containing protein [Solirubrobacteraceae bacterium]
MEAPTRGEVLRRIVERADLELFTDRVLESFWAQPAFEELHQRREEVRAWVRWNLDLVIRWLAEGEPPSDDEIAVFREHARARADEGFPVDMIAGSFRRGARFGWRAMLEAATDAERPVLVEIADLLFEYVDRVSRIYAEVYGSAATRRAPSAEEEAARELLRRIAAEEETLTEDQQLAERIGFRIDRAARPFVIAIPSGHAELAARLRRRGALAASERRRVIGLSNVPRPWRGLELDRRAVIAQGPPAIGSERGHALEELRGAVALAAGRGQSGEIDPRDYLPELLLACSPRIVSQIRARVYSSLDGDHPELVTTLDALIKNNFEKGRVAGVLHVHRNTLRDRIARISELTGVDLERVEGRGLAWLAWLARGE